MPKSLSAKYYEKDKERLQKKKAQSGCERYKNLSEKEKQKLIEYRKNIIK